MVSGMSGVVTDEEDKEDEVMTDLKDRRAESKLSKFRIRAVSTVVLIGSFIACVLAGHVPLMFMIFGIQCLMCNELFKLADRSQRQQKKPEGSGNFQKWYFFLVAAFWLYVRFVNTQLAVEITSNRVLAQAVAWIWKGHSPICFLLYTAGWVAFILKLKKGYYLYQFGQFAWTHLILLFVFVPSSFFVANIFDGIIWFLLPCSLVIINDIGAYLAGICFGRTPLIKISPKKTWEGFLGGLLLTIASAWLLADLMSRFQWMTCPRTDLSVGRLSCQPGELFYPRQFAVHDLAELAAPRLLNLLERCGEVLPAWLRHNLQQLWHVEFIARPMQLHAIVLALCASIIAPFGGFFASGFKRSFKVKDFGNSIPGHGGMTDRMDCQVVMAVLSYLYYNNYAAPVSSLSVGAVLSTVLQLDRKQQLQLFQQLSNLLAERDVVPGRIAEQVSGLPTLGPSPPQ